MEKKTEAVNAYLIKNSRGEGGGGGGGGGRRKKKRKKTGKGEKEREKTHVGRGWTWVGGGGHSHKQSPPRTTVCGGDCLWGLSAGATVCGGARKGPPGVVWLYKIGLK